MSINYIDNKRQFAETTTPLFLVIFMWCDGPYLEKNLNSLKWPIKIAPTTSHRDETSLSRFNVELANNYDK